MTLFVTGECVPQAATAGAVLAAAYVCGSIPFGYLAARAKGVDIRTVGSGNIGATNVKRACGPTIARIVLALDIAKGFVPAFLIAPAMVRLMEVPASIRSAGAEVEGLGAATAAAAAVAGLGAILGHNWPVWLGFRGGKGVAVTIGAFGALLGPWMLVPLGVWVAVVKLTRYVSVASLALAGATAATAGALAAAGRAEGSVVLAGLIAAALIVLRHRENIARLRAGTEPRRGGEASAGDAEETTGGEAG